jgi:hypothetical protein
MTSNKKTKYYSGPDGVFYDKKHDEIFVLEHTGIRLFCTKTFVDNGALFFHSTKDNHKSKIKTALTGMDYAEKIGDL